MASQAQKEQTRDDVLKAACNAARKHGLYTMTRKHVADEAGVSPGTVSFHFADMAGMRRAVIQRAIKKVKFLGVLAQALARRDPDAVKAPAAVKREAMNTLA